MEAGGETNGMARHTARRLAVLAVATLASSCAIVHAGDAMVRMAAPAKLLPDVGAMPLIAAPADDAQRRINAAVKRLDDRVRKAVADCRKQGIESGLKGTDWSRGVEVTMHGPRFLSYTISDNAFCGGAHPNTSTMAIVYDLQSGQPVDWTKLLPPLLAGKLTLNEGLDGTKMVTLSSPLLHALYLTAYRPRDGAVKKDSDDDACREAVATEGSAPAMMAWLDAKAGGLAVQFDLPHAVQACADAVVIPAAALRELNASPALLDALAATAKAE